MTYISNQEEYKQSLRACEEDVKMLYKYGAASFLSKKKSSFDDQGMDKTLYFHCVQFYMPRITHETFEEFQLGVGIFNMQGFEQRNKESKMMMQQHCNHQRQLICANLVEKVWQIFNNEEWNKY